MEDNRLKELRNKKGLTQLRVETKTGIDQSDYSKMENGIRYPTMEQAIALSKLYETSIDYIYRLTDDPRPYPRVIEEDDEE
ncbi:Helix-turn-helix domain [uncultured Eubacterium sp.]|uniref:helix-turn-helix domain-containing protein n=1 Tax=Emergencia sp. TaxID=1926557 RepID=UPI0008222014|nr:Helix-turn-helix domain [uncultured Eubacterium sp.]